MHYLLSLLCICSLMTHHQATELINTYSGTTACNQTIELGSDLFSGVIDFRYEHKGPQLFPIFTCNIRIVTLPESVIVIKFLSSLVNVYVFDHGGCKTQLAIKSNELNTVHCNVHPNDELSSREYMNITYTIRKTHRPYYIEDRFKMIFFTHSFLNSTNECQDNETVCVGTKRCIYQPLKCSKIYDFCNDNLKDCQNNTYNEIVRTRPVPLTGLYILLSCSVFLLCVTVYMCFCQGSHFCECTCHCCIAVDRTGSDVQNESRQNGNGSEEDDQDAIVTTVGDANDNWNEDNSSSVDEVNFDLPPSYSYCERSAVNSSEQNTGDDAADTSVNNLIENNSNIVRRELPPSYSTVLGHEEEYNVHVY